MTSIRKKFFIRIKLIFQFFLAPAPMGEIEIQTLVRIRKASEGLKEDYLGDCYFVKLIGSYGWQE